MIRPEELEGVHHQWQREADYTGQPAFTATRRTLWWGRPTWHHVTLSMIDGVKVRRDGVAVAGYDRPWVTLQIQPHNWSVMHDVTEAEAMKLLKKDAQAAHEAFAELFAEGGRVIQRDAAWAHTLVPARELTLRQIHAEKWGEADAGPTVGPVGPGGPGVL